MRKRPETKDQFIDNALATKLDILDENEESYTAFKAIKWPLNDIAIKPSMSGGSSLNKPINISLKEFEWNTIDAHTKSIGVSKTAWIKYAAFKLLQEEQNYLYNNQKSKK